MSQASSQASDDFLDEGLRCASLAWDQVWKGQKMTQASDEVVFTGGNGLDYFIGLINGFLIFSAAAGISSMGGAAPATSRGSVADAEDFRKGHIPRFRRRFWSSWF